MTMYTRRYLAELLTRIAEPRNKIQVLSGPRQVGKSTLVKQALQQCGMPYLFTTADDVAPTDRLWISNTWASARARMKMQGAREFLLVIDEVHKVDNWSEAVKREWDMDTFNDVGLKVVLLGSSRLLLKDGLTESLAGRYELIRMPHWSFDEMRDAFGWGIEQYVYYGGYPGGASLVADERRWARYVKDSIVLPAIEKDVLTTKTVFKPQLMHRLFALGCEYSGEELSLNKILGQLQDAGNVTTLSNYLTTLNEARLLCGLHKYAVDQVRKYNSIPKFMVYNNALLSAQSGTTFEKAFTTPQLWGRWVESAVGAHLLNQADESDFRVFYWRERADEVDFIVERNRQTIALEVKSGRRGMNAGLGVFGEKFHPTHSYVVGTGGIPMEEFLSCRVEDMF